MWRFRQLYHFGPDDNVRCWTANGFFWSGNFAMALGNTLSGGGSLVLQTTFDAGRGARADRRPRRSTSRSPGRTSGPSSKSTPNWGTADLSSLRFVDHRTPVARHPTVTANWIEPGYAYGNTETFTISSIFPANTTEEEAGGSSGTPLPGKTFKVVDPLTGDTLPLGERGEICVKGPTLMLGYLGTPLTRPSTTRASSPPATADTSTTAGRLFWEGRLTDIIKTGGANVSPLEVDEVLVSHPASK